MNLNWNRSSLAALTKELLVQWQQTKDHWRDSKSQEFERKYLEELLTAVNAATASMQSLEKVIAKIRKDCE